MENFETVNEAADRLGVDKRDDNGENQKRERSKRMPNTEFEGIRYSPLLYKDAVADYEAGLRLIPRVDGTWVVEHNYEPEPWDEIHLLAEEAQARFNFVRGLAVDESGNG